MAFSPRSRKSADGDGDDDGDNVADVGRSKETVLRLNEHLARAKKETQIKADRLRELNRLNEAAKARQAAAAGTASAPAKEYLPFTQVASSVSPIEGVAQVQQAIDSLAQTIKRLGLPENESGPKQIRVLFGAEQCWFRITSKTTFGDLTADACRYWHTDGVLRDQANLAFAKTHRVQQEISRISALSGNSDECVLRLGARIMSNNDNNALPFTPFSPFSPGGATLVAVTPAIDGDDWAGLGSPAVHDKDDDATAADAPAAADEREDATRAVALSAVFHDADVHASASVAQRTAHASRGCAWLFAWAVVIGLVVSAMVFRFTTESAFASSALMRAALVETAFTPQPPLAFAPSVTRRRFASAPREPASENMVQLADVWTWLQDVCLPALFAASSTTAPAMLASATQPLLGSVLLKQWRVSNTSCELALPSGVLVPGSSCYGAYSVAHQQRYAFGPFAFSPSNSPVVYGKMASYDAGGFAQVLNSSWTLAQAQAAVASLQSQAWLGAGTRAVCVFFTLGNTNLGWAVSAQALVEFGASGMVLASLSASVTPLTMYGVFAPYEAVVVVGDVVLCLYALALLWAAVLGPVLGNQASLFRVMQTLWSWVAVFLALLVLVQIICCMVYEFHARYSVDPSTWAVVGGPYNDLAGLRGLFDAIQGLSCATLFLVFVSAFRFMQADLFASRLWQSTHRAARHWGLAVLVFATLLGAMVIWASLAWGPTLHEWSSGASATAKLVGVLFGSRVDFAALRYADYNLFFVCLFFLAWFFVALLVLVQLLGAFVVDAYFEVATVLPLANDDSFAALIGKAMAKAWRSRCARRRSRAQHRHVGQRRGLLPPSSYGAAKGGM